MFSKLVAGSTVALILGRALAGVQFAGVNVAGFDFGCITDGSCTIANIVPPLSQFNGNDGAGQMAHFTNADGFNMYRLPVAWQFLVNNILGGTLDGTNMGKYHALVEACLATGSYCVIDIHNYARWNGQIIGQGGPTNDQFASLWGQLATKYASESKVVMGIMNEPHDIPDIKIWAASVQAAVTAIRKEGATSQYILLPGNDYTSAGSFVTSGSAAALSTVTNLDGSTTNLIFDVHKYFDSDNSGTHINCVDNHINDSFSPLATYLRQNQRMAVLSEAGGGSENPSCITHVCSALEYLNQNSDVYLGYVGWGAGSFDSTYVLSLTPSGSASTGWTDKPLLKQCFAGQFANPGNGTSSPEAPPSAAPPLPATSVAGHSLASSVGAPASSAPANAGFSPPSSYAAPASNTQAGAPPSNNIPVTPSAPSSSATVPTAAGAANLFGASPTSFMAHESGVPNLPNPPGNGQAKKAKAPERLGAGFRGDVFPEGFPTTMQTATVPASGGPTSNVPPSSGSPSSEPSPSNNAASTAPGPAAAAVVPPAASSGSTPGQTDDADPGNDSEDDDDGDECEA